jgi:alpha-galactosidase
VSWHRRLATPEVRSAIAAAFRRAAEPQPVGEPLDWFETLQPVSWRFGGLLREYDWK